MAEHHHGARLALRLRHRRIQRGQQRIIDGVALGGAVQADPGDAVAQFQAHRRIGHRRIGHRRVGHRRFRHRRPPIGYGS